MLEKMRNKKVFLLFIIFCTYQRLLAINRHTHMKILIHFWIHFISICVCSAICRDSKRFSMRLKIHHMKITLAHEFLGWFFFGCLSIFDISYSLETVEYNNLVVYKLWKRQFYCTSVSKVLCIIKIYTRSIIWHEFKGFDQRDPARVI